jgi:divinyl protochlorophyllide a 8-vinyl-reductase
MSIPHEQTRPSKAAAMAAAAAQGNRRIGPNAVTQLIVALQNGGEGAESRRIFSQAGSAQWLDSPPTEMVDETRVAKFHATVRELLPEVRANAILREAGRTTAEYILANRIPRLAQGFLKILPAPLAARALTRAIGAHAWTFAGTGRFRGAIGREAIFEIWDNPLCRERDLTPGLCVWHTAVFERLFCELVSAHTLAEETQCLAQGAPCCRFILTWRPCRSGSRATNVVAAIASGAPHAPNSSIDHGRK